MDSFEDQNNSSLKLWLLVEIESYGNRISKYIIVDSDEVIGEPTKNNMHTGKTVKIRKGKITIPATVVIISDDKDFLETELKQLNSIELNKTTNNTIKNETDLMQAKKRRRTVNDIQILHQETFLMPKSNWQDTNHERIIVPNTTIISNNISTPPMTFDQQTQTDLNNQNDDNNLLKNSQLKSILSAHESIFQTQKMCLEESHETKNLIKNMQNQIDLLKSMTLEISKNLNKIVNSSTSSTSSSSSVNTSNAIILNSRLSTNHNNTSKILFENPNDSNTTENEVIFTFEAEESIQSNNNSNLSLNDTNQSNCSDKSIVEKKFDILKNYNGKNTNKILNGSSANNIDNIITEWNKDIGADDEALTYDGDADFIIIGSNKTQVSQHVIRSINWTSHTAATRKLLMALFPRSVLATHSLTGKPSPAFMDRQKPIKNQLDSKIVADIIQIVTKLCRVPESVVRNAITTKCADENKMNRQRMVKSNSIAGGLNNMKDDDKENLSKKK